MPSENRPEHTWRTRIDPFEKIWNTEIKPLLELNNGLEAKTVFQQIQEKRHLQPLPENRLPVYTEYKDIYVSNANIEYRIMNNEFRSK